MLIVDVSKTLGGLAEAINKKSAEIARLEQEYKTKLEILNRYISKLELDSNEGTLVLQSQDKLLRLINSEISCSKCLNIVYDPKNNSEYVLIPKSQVEILHDERVDIGTEGESKETEFTKNLTENEAPEKISPESKSKKSKPRKTCSYCNEPGHSRARCFSRLTTPVGSSKAHTKS